jgi:hypothetical protein
MNEGDVDGQSQIEGKVVNTPIEPHRHEDPDGYRVEARGVLPYDWSRRDG